jgi:NOL1/NOP2/fmu family ribosome biogenesis protein
VSDMSFVSSLSKETTNMVILRVWTIAIGVGKYVTGEIKNKFPVW